MRLVIVSTGVNVISKTDGEMHVLSIFKIYSYYSFVFSLVPLKIEFKNYRKLLCRFLPPGKIVDKKKINLLVSAYCTLLFSRKGITKFYKVALVPLHCNCLICCIVIPRDSGLEILPILQRIFTCSSKTAIKTLRQNVKFVQTFLSTIWLP